MYVRNGKKINNRIPTYLLAYLPTLIVKELKISGNNIKYNQTLNILFSVVK